MSEVQLSSGHVLSASSIFVPGDTLEISGLSGGEVLTADVLAAMTDALYYAPLTAPVLMAHPAIVHNLSMILNLQAQEIVGVTMEIGSLAAFKEAVKAYDEGYSWVASERMSIGGFDFTFSSNVPKSEIWFVNHKTDRYVKVDLKFLNVTAALKLENYSFEEEEEDSWYDPRQA